MCTPLRGWGVSAWATARMVRPHVMPTRSPSATFSSSTWAPMPPSSCSSSSSVSAAATTRACARPKRSHSCRPTSEDTARGSRISMLTNPRSFACCSSLDTVGREIDSFRAMSACGSPRW